VPTIERIDEQMPLSDALSVLGVTAETLNESEKATIDRDGYIVFEGLFTRDEAHEFAAKLDAIAAAEGEKAGNDFHTEPGTTRLGNLMNKDDTFDVIFTHPKVLAALNYITHGDFGVSSLTGRAALPGEGAQPLHVDFGIQGADGTWTVTAGISANALVACDDFTQLNGATRLVPGSHKLGRGPGDSYGAGESHTDEVQLIVPAGSVAVIDGATWHGGTCNNSDKARHLISVMCQPRGKYQDWAYRKISRETAARLSAAALFVLDHQVVD